MDCDWIFVKNNGARVMVTLDEKVIPSLGDGKINDGIGYKVQGVAAELVSRPNPVIFAVETP